MESKINKLYDFVVLNEIATPEELSLAYSLCGRSLETLWRVIDIKTELHNMDQLKSDGCVDTNPDLDLD